MKSSSHFTLHPVLRAILGPLFWIAVWTLTALIVGRSVIVPLPHAVLARLLELGGTKLFWLSCLRSLGNIFFGLFFGVLFGTVCAVGSFFWKAVHTLLTPAVSVIKATPVASFIILLLFFFSRESVAPIATALMVFPVVFTNVEKGFSSVQTELSDVAKVYRFSRAKKWKTCYYPSVKPYFAAAMRTATGLGWKAGIAAEVISSPGKTIGAALYDSKNYLATEDLFAWTVVVIILSFLIEKLITGLALGREKEEKA